MVNNHVPESANKLCRNKKWGNSFLAKRTAEVLVKIGIVATVTVGGMDAVVEPSGTSLWRVTEKSGHPF
ncbi:hypothetical protein C8I07_03515 [Shewanella baltica]|nr:hypothetical protein C8I07_03515 [Shewanella baltica]